MLERMQFLDLVTYLPDDILTKVDRASMAVALEARVPLLDHRVVEFSWRLPRAPKYAMARASGCCGRFFIAMSRRTRRAPEDGIWHSARRMAAGPLRDWAEALLSERRLREAGLLDHALVCRYWQEHIDGRRNWQYLLWDVLMLEAWRERWT